MIQTDKFMKEEKMNLTITIPDEILQSAHLTIPKIKQEIAELFWQKHYMTLEQASQFAEISSYDFLGQLKEESTQIDNERQNKLMREEKMIILSHFEWERFMALQENPPSPPEKLKQLMQRKPLIG